MINSKGSILREFGEVTGVDHVTHTSVRRSYEPRIQSTKVLRSNSKAITQHSVEVGEKIYNKLNPELRVATMEHINEQDQANRITVTEDDSSGDNSTKRRLLEENDVVTARKRALTLINEVASNTKVKRGSRCKVLKDERIYISRLFTTGGKFGDSLSQFDVLPGIKKTLDYFILLSSIVDIFIGEKEFVVIFYSVLDNLDSEDECRSELWKIDRNIFKCVKNEIEGSWIGSVEQHSEADKLVASAIRASLLSYETRRDPKTEESFFKLK